MPFLIAYRTYGFYYSDQLAHCTCQVPLETETRAVSASVFTAPKQRQGFVRKPLSNTTPFVVDPYSFLTPKYLFPRFREQDSGVSYANINAQDPSRQLVERLLIHTLCCTPMHTHENHVYLWSFQATETGCMVRLRDVRPMTY